MPRMPVKHQFSLTCFEVYSMVLYTITDLTDTKNNTAGPDKTDKNSFWAAGFLSQLSSGSSRIVVA